MSQKPPQNPVYPVDPAAMETCRPKAICGQCGTVFCIKVAAEAYTARCPACDARHRVENHGDRWNAQLLNENNPE